MPPIVEKSQHVLMHYAKGGQFTFKRFIANPTNEQMYDLAMRLNSFQDNSLDKVFKVRVTSF